MRIAAFAVVVFRVLLALLAVLYFTIALAILGVRYVILPNLDNHVPDIERFASRAIGAPVQIDSLQADWHRLNPQLHLSGVRVYGQTAQPALELARVDVLLSWRSLLTFQPELLRLQLRSPMLEARRDADGLVAVAGFPIVDTGKQGRLAEHAVTRWLLRQRSIEIHDAKVRWHDEFKQAQPVELEHVNAVLRYTLLNGTRFAVQAGLPASVGHSLDIRGEVRRSLFGMANIGQAPQWYGRVYGAVQDLNLAAAQPWLPAAVQRTQGRIAARAWVDFEDGVIGRWSGDLAVKDVSGKMLGTLDALQVSDARIQLRGDAARKTISADVRVGSGMVSLPAIFDRGSIPVHGLTAALEVASPGRPDARWRFERVRLDVGEADARTVLQADAVWRAAGRSRAGTIDLSGRVEHAQVGAIGRFMPRVVGPGVREWLRDGLAAGSVQDAEVRLAGDLADFPFDRSPRQHGAFRVSGRVHGLKLHVAPHAEHPWLPFEDVEAKVLVERSALTVQVDRAVVRESLPRAIALERVHVKIPQLQHGAVLSAQGEASGTAESFLAFVRGTPLAAISAGALDKVRATGNFVVPLQVVAPLATAGNLAVKGAVRFADNTLRLHPDMPAFSKLTGEVAFSDKAISLERVKGVVLGGAFTADGKAGHEGGQIALRGELDASSLHAWWPVQGMKRLTGKTPYSATVNLDDKAGTTLAFDASLQGMALTLPAPLDKPAAAQWPVQFTLSGLGTTGSRRLDVSLAQVAGASLEFAPETGADGGWRVLRGAVGVNRPALLPDQGLRADIRTAEFDLDAWDMALDEFTAPVHASRRKTAQAPYDGAVAVDIQSTDLKLMDFRLGAASLNAVRKPGGQWRAAVDSAKVAGTVEWSTRGTGDAAVQRVDAKFTRLALDMPRDERPASPAPQQQASRMPDIQLVADEFFLGDWHLGRLKLAGSGDGRQQWLLKELLLENPDATLQATGEWEPRPGPATDRRMTLHTQWRIRDLGRLLARFDMPDVVAGGAGDAKGTLSWTGQPFSYDLASLQGHVGLALDKGRFLQAPSTAGRLLGILSLQSLARAATFRSGNLFEAGFAWDTIRSDISVDRGVAQIGSFSMDGPSATAVLSGRTDLVGRTQDLRAVIVPHFDASAAALLAGLAINPVIGVGAFVTQWILRHPLAQAFTYQYAVTGSWSEPQVSLVESK